MEKSLHSKRQQLLIELLKKARKVAGLTQQEVADKLGKPQSFVAKYENGERRLDVVEFIDVTAALDAAPGSIISKLESGS